MRSRLLSCVLLSSLALPACGEDEVPPSLSRVTQPDLDRMASALNVEFTVIENIVATCPEDAPWELCLDAKITITNDGPEMSFYGWSIYFSSIRRVLATTSPEFSITHVNGDLHKIEPTGSFKGFGASESKEIPLQSEYWMLSETDVMPRYYVTAPDLKPAVIASTDTEDLTEFVSPFTDSKQTRRTPDDESVIATASTRFAQNESLSDLGADGVASSILPTPMNLTVGDGTLDLSDGVTLDIEGLDDFAIDAIEARLAQLHVDVKSDGGIPVSVSVQPNAFDDLPAKEAYRLVIDDSSITIVGGDAAGAFYGLQSLVALIPAGDSAPEIPQVEISYDAPRYEYRGAQLDLARNFHGVDSVLLVLEQMAAYKLNTLHLHLSDDEGWRLEIPGLPELTDVAGKRCHDLEDATCLLPQLGSGPDTSTSGTGHLTRAQFVDILEKAKARNIKVIPEFDMPGHARAAIKAMEARAKNGDDSFLLSDPEDASVYLSVQRYKDNAINGCLDSTYAFIEKVMDEVLEMYDDAGLTLDTWHFGGDEVGDGAWANSPACDDLYASNSDVKGPQNVHEYFVKRLNDLALARDLGIRGWSDGMRKANPSSDDPPKVFLNPATDLGGNTVSTNWWGTLFWWDNSAYTMANLGYKVVLTSPDFLYLDHPYEADPKERGYYWATRYTDLKKLFSYISGNLPANSQLSKDRMGMDYSAAFENVADLTIPENVIGIEAPLWSETVRTAEQLEYMVFPRLLAVAERAWHRAEWEPADGNDPAATIDTDALNADWERFANTLGYKELRKLDRAGVRYRVEVPGARNQGGTLQANVANPGLTIEYRVGDGDWTAYDPEDPPAFAESMQVRAVTSNGRAGRAVNVE